MTTDTVPKQVAFEFELSGKTCHIGGMIKGSGMIHPNMATTLSFITTDAAVSPVLLKKMLSEVVQTTLNCVSVDGDQSTNDMCCVMANGMAENKEVEAESEDYNILYTALYLVLVNLARMMARDGEGATKLIECSCGSAESFEKAKTVAKSVIMSNLFKAAIFGEDANWGRILCAVGYSDAEFDIEKVDVNIASKAGRIAVCRKGAGVDFSEEKAKEILKEESILIEVELNEGSESAFAWGCDLTYNYVKINGDYRS
jgi:glutamate N-acetyltransferase/amino-acid N-acetyltransferase